MPITFPPIDRHHPDGTQAELTQHCVQVVVIDVGGDEIVFSVDDRHSHERVLLARSEDAHIGPAKDPFDGAVVAVENAPHKLNMEVWRRTNEKRGKVVNLCGAYTLCVEWYVEIGRVRSEQGGGTFGVSAFHALTQAWMIWLSSALTLEPISKTAAKRLVANINRFI